MSLPRHTIGVTLTDAQLQRLDELAAEIFGTRSDVLKKALELYDTYHQPCPPPDIARGSKLPPDPKSVFGAQP